MPPSKKTFALFFYLCMACSSLWESAGDATSNEEEDIAAAIAASVGTNQQDEQKRKEAEKKAQEEAEKKAQEQAQQEEKANMQKLEEEKKQLIAQHEQRLAAQRAMEKPYELPVIVNQVQVLPQEYTECGPRAVMNGAEFYKVITSYDSNKIEAMKKQLKSEAFVHAKQTAYGKLQQCATYESTNIMQLMKAQHGGIPYTIIANAGRLSTHDTLVIEAIKKLRTKRNTAHLFFLYIEGGHQGGSALGHWIAVVVHNACNKLNFYVFDSQNIIPDSSTRDIQPSLIKKHDLEWLKLKHFIELEPFITLEQQKQHSELPQSVAPLSSLQSIITAPIHAALPSQHL